MRATEFIKENASVGATASGCMAVAEQPLGELISRPGITKPAKYANSVKTTHNRTKTNAIR